MRSLIFAAAAVLSVTHAGRARAEDCERKVGDRMPDVKGVDVNGKSTSVKASKGWVFVTVGASWCEPCKKELPAWDKLAPDYGKKLTFIAVDVTEKVDDGKQFHKDLKIENLSPIYTGGGNSVGNLGSVMPSTYVVDPNGVIRYERCGFEKEGVDGEIKTMRAALSKLLP